MHDRAAYRGPFFPAAQALIMDEKLVYNVNVTAQDVLPTPEKSSAVCP
jgi:hypothetical protein